MRFKLKLFAIVLLCCLLCSIAYFLFTSRGSSFLVRKGLSHYAGVDQVDFTGFKGSLFRDLEWEGVTVKDCRRLPAGLTIQAGKVVLGRSSLTRFTVEIHDLVLSLRSQPGRLILVQRVKITSGLGRSQDLSISVEGGRTKFLKTETILFHGAYNNDVSAFNFFTKWVDIKALVGFLNIEKLKGISGAIVDADIDIKGPLPALNVAGELTIEKITRNGFFLRNAPLLFALQVRSILKDPQVFGMVTVKAGEVQGPKTALIQLQNSKFVFNGDIGKPDLNLKGSSVLGDTQIDIGLTGTVQKPVMVLKSKPSLPQDRLLVMLGTNKRLAANQSSSKEGQLSGDQVKDFIDYFLFDNKVSKLGQDLGLSTSVTIEKQKQGASVTKTVTKKIGATYSVERIQEGDENQENKESVFSSSRKLGAEYKFNDAVSVGVEREVKQSEGADKDQGQAGQPAAPDNKFLLKIKKEF